MDWLRNLTKSAAEKRQEMLNAYVDGRLSPQQQAQFEQELARDERLRDVLAEPGLHYYAGFPYRQVEQPMCAAHSRCVHVIVSADDGQRHVAHAIVDLMTRKVVLPKLDEWRNPDPVSNEKNS